MLECYQWTLKSLLGKIIKENLRDYDTQVQFIMGAYTPSVHDATGYTTNFMAFGREV